MKNEYGDTIKNLYVYQINEDDGQQVFADTLRDAQTFVEKSYMSEGDTLHIEMMGSDYNVDHWEYDGQDKV